MNDLRWFIQEHLRYAPDRNEAYTELKNLELKNTTLTITYSVFVPEEKEEIAIFDILGNIAKKISGRRAHYFYDAIQNWLDSQI